MHHSMLPLFISCTRSRNFAWHLLWRSTTGSKSIAKLLAISQTRHTVCCKDDYIFQTENLNYSIVCFTQRTWFFQKVCFLLGICLPFVICGTYVTKIDAVLWHSRQQTFVSLSLFTWLVYVRTYCVPIATFNQNKRTRLLHLGDAQIITASLLSKLSVILLLPVFQNKRFCLHLSSCIYGLLNAFFKAYAIVFFNTSSAHE